MKKILKRLHGEYIIAIAIMATLICVVATGIFSYRNLKRIINDVWISQAFDDKRTLLKGIMFDISSAEANVKSFYLTRDDSFLPAYFEISERIAEKIDKLETVKWENETQKIYFREFSILIENKFQVLNELLYLQNNEHITDELNKITEKINDIRKDSAVVINDSVIEKTIVKDTVITPPEQTGFLRRLFKKKKEPIEQAPVYITSFDTIKVKKVDYTEKINQEVKKEISTVKKSQIELLRELKAQELDLAKRDVELNKRILHYLSLLETSERNIIIKRNDQAIKRTNGAIYLIGGFCLLIILLLMVAGFFILRYIIHNKVYRKYLKQKQEEAIKLARAKQNILSNMSHEIRTPLNSIIGFSNQISGSDLNKEQKIQLEIIKKSANHLLGVINNILDFSKLDAGKFQLQKKPFSPYHKIKDTFELVRIQAEEKGLSLKMEVPFPLPEVLIGDAMCFSQVILNILSNAVKYSDKGEIILNATATEKGDISVIKIIITDSGVGIPAEKVGLVFKQFEQASANFSHKGTGLGLPIAKKLAQLQGGDIKIESEEFKGTKVTITFSIKTGKISDLKKKLTPTDASTAILKNKKVLIADDEEFNRMLLQAMLNKYNIKFAEAKDGEEVLQKVKTEYFDLILMDIRMPLKSGLEACEAIRKMEDEKTASVPIIALTAGLPSEEMKICMSAGMNEFISKPYKEDELIQKMIKLFSPTINS